ncbi:MAG TPA: 5'-nucleotidase, lipoprotein e(P4) family [Pyrinomonadaceae bacterium]|nr:5'-nucleotidase, lipoprotein e(P4) family [Pyrinomonadaceae bacterium]
MRYLNATVRLLILSGLVGVCGSIAFAQVTAPKADLDYQTAAVLYMQKSAEYRALCYQAYNLARLRLDEDLDKKNVKKLPKDQRKLPRSIIVDIDETVLDNSPSQANGIKTGRPFSQTDWYAWGDMKKAKAIPGAVDFLNYAVSKGVKIFFISNRDEVQKAATIENLKTAGFNDVSSDNVLLRTAESGKDARRSMATKKHRIVLLVGDNLDDFTSSFERKSVADRFAEVERDRPEFGKRFIVLPNAMYGTWENAIYEYGRLTEAQKAEKRAAALELP